MPEQTLPPPWTQPGWLEQASAWIHAELERQGIRVSGPIVQSHVRPWSTVLRAPTTEGDIYFKAAMPALAHEPGLTQALARWRPDCLPEVLAADPERGWMLMADFGATLRSHIQSAQDLWHWHRVLPRYAEMQIEMAGRLPELLALGALDRRLTTLPEQYERMLTDVEVLRIDLPQGLTAEEHRRLREHAPTFAATCAQLASYRLPETLHHDDFHDGNVFVRQGRYIFSDWAESCAAHPFFTLLVTLRSITYRLKLEEGSREVTQLRDLYLEPWTRYESRANLLMAFELGQRVAMVCRALTWRRVVAALDAPFRIEHADAVPGWLQDFLSAEAEAAA
ncbi:MAG TPA: phosphotransferase [Anaerolineales bacterium]|nr:phosphotransferase [Anaerolineales bacterium]